MSHTPASQGPRLDRRGLLRAGSALTVTGLFGGLAGASPLFAPGLSAASTRANNTIGLGVIGTGKRVFNLMGQLLGREDLRIVSVCDVDTTRREHVRAQVNDHYGNTDCTGFNDHREVLSQANVDAVLIATPDHWHAHQIIDACHAGKDIYCEKPLTLNLHEAHQVLRAVRRHDRVFQTGSQQRTEYGHKFAQAVEYVLNGRIGRLLNVNVGVGNPSTWCDLAEEEMEAGLDWDRWLGPAPERPFNAVLSPRGVHSHYPMWRLYREYSGGMMTDFGAHHFDIAQWGLDADQSGPVEIIPPQDDSDDRGAVLRYANGVEVIHGGPNGITFVGTDGLIHVDRGRLEAVPGNLFDEPLGEDAIRLPRPANHLTDWMDCIRSRQRPVCDVEVGARSVAVCHLANLSYWNRRELRWDPTTWQFLGDEEANGWRDYERRAGYELPSIS
ncbi:MAG: Gfo/Idh/MocA family protein [Planctomycetota bacterium]|jgi:predicted dehydrogenase